MAAATLTAETAVNSSFTPTSIYFEDNRTVSLQSCVVVSFYIINIVLGLPSNSYIAWLITTGAGSGVASEFLSLNLAVCEITVCFSSLPTVFYIVSYDACINYIMRYIVIFFSILLCMGRPLFQCCVCVERYVAVVHPVLFLKCKPLRYRLGFSAIIWLIVLGFCTSNMLLLSDRWMYYMLLPFYILLFSIEVFCSLAVLRVLRQPSPGYSARDVEVNHMKKRAFWFTVVFLVSVGMNLCPVVFFAFVYGVLSEVQKLKGTAFVFSAMVLTGFVHPFMFLYKSGKLTFIHCL